MALVKMNARLFAIAAILLVTVQEIAAKKINDSKGCHPSCGKTHGTGSCDSNNKCLCWWGYTGPKSKYIKKGRKKGMIEAEFCEWTCHYTADYSNPRCADDGNSSDGGSDSECGSDSDSDEGEW